MTLHFTLNAMFRKPRRVNPTRTITWLSGETCTARREGGYWHWRTPEGQAAMSSHLDNLEHQVVEQYGGSISKSDHYPPEPEKTP